MSRFFKRTLSFLGLAEDESNDYSNDDYSNSKISGDDFFKEDVQADNKNSFSSYGNEGNTEIKRVSRFRPGRKLLSINGAKNEKKSRVSIAELHEFEEVQMIGDSFKENIPVIINLQNTNQDLAKRIVDFCSGLTYALGGSIKKVADKVFLITPSNVIVTSREKEILKGKGLYNQL